MRYPSLFSGLNELLAFEPLENFQPNFINHGWKQEDNKLVAHFDLPGLTKEEVKVNIENKIIHVYGVQEKNSGNKKSLRSYSYKTFIPKEVDAESLSASYENGVLKIEGTLCESSKKSKFLPIK
jgi:HSP20 family molecular chaperone IbpA